MKCDYCGGRADYTIIDRDKVLHLCEECIKSYLNIVPNPKHPSYCFLNKCSCEGL